MRQSRFTNRARFCATTSIVSLIGLLAAGPALAQEVAGLEEVVVTARKVAENLQDIPVAVTAFTGEDLQQQNATRITDVGRMTPGITFRQSSTNPSGMLVSLRGQFQRDTSSAFDPSVGLYVDGVYWARAYGLNADLVDLQSVQVLKGPQGTLFGRNTTGGAVLLQTNDPKYDRIEGMVSGTFGRFNERALTGVLNMPIITDKVAVRGALQISQRDGYITDIVSGRKYDNRDTVTGRVKLGLRPTESLNVVLSAEKYTFDQAGQARSAYFLPGSAATVYAAEQGNIAGMNAASYVNFVSSNPDLTAANAITVPSLVNLPDSEYETETYTGTVNWDTGIGAFKLVAAHRATAGHSALDLDGSPWSVHNTFGFVDLKQASVELQLTGKTWGDAIEYAGGVFYFTEDGTDGSYSSQMVGGQASSNAVVRGSAATGANVVSFIDNTSKGAYGQLIWHATDRLSFTGGLRYSWDERGISLRARTLTPTGAFLSCSLAALGSVRSGDQCTPISRTADFESGSYLASADYKLTEDVLVYAKYSKGYRSGGQPSRAATPAAFVPFGPEIVHEAEIGLKSEFFDRRLRLNVSAYRSTIDGAQRSAVVAPPGGGATQSIFGNAAQVRVTGIEAEATAVLGGGFMVTASGAITKPKYLSYSEAPTAAYPTGDRTGDRFNAVPEEQAAIAINYEREISGAQLAVRVDYSWAGETPLDEFNIVTNPQNALVIANTTRPAGGEANIRAGLTFDEGRYEVAAYGRNIFDNRDLVSALQVASPFGYIGRTWREPATFGVQGTYRFGQ